MSGISPVPEEGEGGATPLYNQDALIRYEVEYGGLRELDRQPAGHFGAGWRISLAAAGQKVAETPYFCMCLKL